MSNSLEYRVVIPARYASTRLPGKPLADIGGRPMLQHVFERASRSGAAEIVIATDDRRIADVCTGFGGTVCMTRADHPSGTDRIAEVIRQMGWADETLVVNLQGDEPLVPPALLDQVAANLHAHPSADVATLSVPMASPAEIFDSNAVKVVVDAAGYALYFSRAPIPWHRGSYAGFAADTVPVPAPQRHLGIYAYRAGAVLDFVRWGPAPIEQAEALEQLRVLWNGGRIHVEEACVTPPAGIDTPEDLERVRAQFP